MAVGDKLGGFSLRPDNDERPDDGAESRVRNFELGERIGAFLSGDLRYSGRDFWEWTDGNRWVIVEGGAAPDHITDWILAERWNILAAVAADRVTAAAEDNGGAVETKLMSMIDSDAFESDLRQHIMPGVRWSLKRPFKAETSTQILATPGEMVDLRAGKVWAHKSRTSDNRAILGGSYRPGDLEQCWGLVRDRFKPVLVEQELQRLVRCWGLSLSGRAQTYTGLFNMLGGEGHGKGGTARLILAAGGQRAMVLGRDFFSKQRGEIDATGFWLVIYRPLAVTIDESVGSGRGFTDKLLTFTGDNEQGPYRLPHGREMVKGLIPCAVWLSSAAPPGVTRGTGFDRRYLPISFPRKLRDGEKSKDELAQDLLDAWVTLGIEEAKTVWQEGYVPPVADPAFRRDALHEADPLSGFLQGLGAHYEGKKAREVADAANEALQPSRPYTPTAITRKVNNLANADPEFRWTMETLTSGSDKNIRALKLRPTDSETGEFDADYPIYSDF